MQQRELPRNLRATPLLRIVERNVTGAGEIDERDERGENRHMHGIKANESMPKKYLYRVAGRLGQACEIDVRDDESREHEEEVNSEITAGEKRQNHSGPGGHVLVGMQPEHQQGCQRTDAGQRRYIMRGDGRLFFGHVKDYDAATRRRRDVALMPRAGARARMTFD